jgi:hypothetical protein
MDDLRTGKFAARERLMSQGPMQGSTTMKSLLLAGLMSAAFATSSYADQYWVAGNRNTGKCDIVNSQPVTYSLPAYDGAGSEYQTAWTSGPYQSLDDA